MSLVLSGYFMQALASIYPECDFYCGRVYGFRVVLYWSGFAIFYILLATNAARKMAKDSADRRGAQGAREWSSQTVVH